LKTSNPITVTLTSSNGFSGDVALVATVVDANNAPIPGWTVDLSAPSMTLAANGTATAVATLNIPAMNTGLAGTMKVTAMSSATTGTNTVAATVTALNQVTFSIKADATTKRCEYPADGGPANPATLALGTKVRFYNTGTVNIEIHSGGIISHQGKEPNGLDDPVTEPNTAYEQLPTGTGTASWYCHAPSGNPDMGDLNPKFVVQ